MINKECFQEGNRMDVIIETIKSQRLFNVGILLGVFRLTIQGETL